jgi:hypothetical protein
VPKTRVAPRPAGDDDVTDVVDDLPIWDALVAELGDPRPYEPTVVEFAAVAATDEPCVDDAAFDDALSDLDLAVEDVETWYADRESEVRAAVDDVITEFCDRHGIVVATTPTGGDGDGGEDGDTTAHDYDDPTLLALLNQTVVLPVLTGERTVRFDREGEVRWPS